MTETMEQDGTIILLPLFNDWSSVTRLLSDLDGALDRGAVRAEVLIVDDGSVADWHADLRSGPFRALSRVSILHLRRNVGHQRAICIGLAYIDAKMPCERVVVMDSDGEDDPEDVPRLLAALEESGGGSVVFAERSKRSERLAFRAFYHLFRLLHWILVGHDTRMGNFSVVPAARLKALTVVPELWNHYAAAVQASRQPYRSIPTARAKRLEGESKMNFVSLTVHGLSAMSVFSDRIAVRVLVGTVALTVLLVSGLGIAFCAHAAIPFWGVFAGGLFVLLLCQTLCLTLVFAFTTLQGRAGMTLLPARDYAFFVDRIRTVYGNE